MIIQNIPSGRFRWLTVGAVVANLAAAGCGDESPQSTLPLITDSAGVRIVTNQVPSLGESAWSVSAEPALSIGSENDPLFVVRGATRLSDGTIVVGNAGAYELNYYASSGGLAHRAGGRGVGPGEFGGGEGYFNNVWPVGADTVAVWRHSNSRLTLFDAEGRLATVVTVRREPVDFTAAGVLSGPRLVGFSFVFRQPAFVGEVWRDTARLVVSAPDGTSWTEVDQVLGFSYQGAEFRDRLSTGRLPFGKRPHAAVQGDRLYYGSGERSEIRVYRSDGVLESLLRWPETDRRVTAEHVRAEKQRTMAGAPDDPGSRAEWQRAVDESRYAEEFPAHGALLVDRTGTLWVQDYPRLGETQQRWSVFARDGVWQTTVVMPANVHVFEFGPKYVLGLWRDDLDVEHVQLYDLIK